jgi:release factor glutamine methyltransferase
MANQIWTIGSILKWTGQYFGTRGIESPRLDAEVLLSHVLGKPRIYLYVHFDEPLEAAELAQYREYIRQRVARQPVAYIVGRREFMGLTFQVTPAVLVPQPDTEVLVQAAIDRLPAMPTARVADIGTGSGAIALSLLYYMKQLRAAAVDISQAALTVAAANAAALGVADRAVFYEGDLLAPLAGETFTAIVSNPPYIPTADIAGLAPEVRSAEPMGALDGGADGLAFYRRLVANAPAFIVPGGFLAVEVGIHEAQPVIELAERQTAYDRTEILKDLAGIDRVVVLWTKGSV